MAYETPIEKAQLEILGRIADALEGIRFNLATNLATITSENNALRSSNKALNDTIQRIQAPADPPKPPEGHKLVIDSLGKAYFVKHPRQVLTETENGIETQPTLTEYHDRIKASEEVHINEPDYNS